MTDAVSAQLSRRGRIPIFIALTLLAATIVYPLIFVVLTSLRPNADYLQDPFGLPGVWTIGNYITLATVYGAGRAFLNSLLVTIIAMVIVLVLSSIAGYALAKLPVPGARFMNRVFVSVLLIPAPVLIIPIYLMLSRLELVGSYPGLILVYVALGLPFSTFFLTVTFRSIPDEVIEAAKLDGAGFLRTMRAIVVPMGAGGIATLAVLQFLAMWNELIFALILIPDQTQWLLTPALSSIGERFVTDQPVVSAGLFLSACVPLLLLGLTSRYIVQGLHAGVSR